MRIDVARCRSCRSARADRGHAALRQWLTRGGFTAEPLRWFCGTRGNVVVEQRGHWFTPRAITVEDSGGWIITDTTSERIVASAFSVVAGRVVRYQRFDQLRDALFATSLSDDDEVLLRS
jgi:hypothetical protein